MSEIIILGIGGFMAIVAGAAILGFIQGVFGTKRFE